MTKFLITGLLLFLLPFRGMVLSYQPRSDVNDTLECWVFFTDKHGVAFDPYTYFHPRAIERRLRHGQCLSDTSDFPVKQAYLDSLAFFADSISVVSRWLNAASVYISPKQLETVRNLPFVASVSYPSLALYTAAMAGGRSFKNLLYPGGSYQNGDLDDPPDQPYALSIGGENGLTKDKIEKIHSQTSHLDGELFSENGFEGKNIRVAIFDGGFPGVDEHPAFRHIREEGRIIDTWDFHMNRKDVYRYNAHGTMVFSVIAGMAGDVAMGLATGAEFLLARTELSREPLAEEKYWVAAAEWADRLGADIINSSLGYVNHRYFPEQMDGQSSVVARAAGIAARKGILIVNAAGNEGEKSYWRIIITPADVDSVLTVGAVDYPSLLRTSYTSLGPTADKRMKPNVVAMGNVIVATKSGFRNARGTSFSSPLVAGYAACLWQMFPEWTNMEVFKAIEQSATLYPYFDYSHGFGVPKAGYFFRRPVISPPTIDLNQENGKLLATIRKQGIDRSADEVTEKYVFYHIRDEKGQILRYYVIKAENNPVLTLDKKDFNNGYQLYIHYDGYTTSWTF